MEEQISKWIGDYCNGTLDAKAEKELLNWIHQSKKNQQQFEDAVLLVRKYQTYKLLQTDKTVVLKKIQNKIAIKRRRMVQRRMIAVAAGIVLLLGLSTLWYSRDNICTTLEKSATIAISPGSTKAILQLDNGMQFDLNQIDLKQLSQHHDISLTKDSVQGLRYDSIPQKGEQPQMHTISVPIGGEYHLTLADGTKVWLNSATKLSFPTFFAGDTREVFVDGEAYFDVAHNPRQPFIVHTSQQVKIQVLGTQFNVSTYSTNVGVITTLVEGCVQLNAECSQVTLKPGHQAIVDSKSKTIQTQKVNLTLYTSWIKGVFEYENMTLEEITHQLARWYNVKFSFIDNCCASRRFTGIARKYMNLQEVLTMIEETTDVKFNIQDDMVTIQSKK